MIRYGDMEINCSLDMLFARLRESLESEVNKILFNQN
jgi:vacuolar-type H+-ATPase subunit E/Vma4